MTPSRAPVQSAWRGFLLLVAAMMCFAVLDTTTKSTLAKVSTLVALWVLFLIQALLTTGYVLYRRGIAGLKTRHLRLHVIRGSLLTGVQAFAFLSLRFLPVGEFTALAMTTPLLVTLLAARVLGEHVSPIRLLLVAGGLAGTLVIVRPGSNAIGWVLLLPMGLVLLNSAYQLLTSRMARTEDAVPTLCYTTLTGLLITSVPLLWFWEPIAEPGLWLPLLLMGLAATSGNLLFILAFERAPAATLMPYMYLQIGFGIAGGWWVFQHVPDTQSVLGMLLIAVCGMAGAFLTLYEQRMRRAS